MTYPEVGAIYEHFRGGRYVIKGLALDSETKDFLVIYQSVTEKTHEDGSGGYEADAKEPWWARPLGEFLQEVGSPPVKRFRPLDRHVERDFQLHDRVRKNKGDYTFEGKVISCLVKRGGAVRYVVEDDRGLMLILNKSQLEKVQVQTEAK